MKIAVATSSFARCSEEPLDLLRREGAELVLNDTGRTLSEEETVRLLEGCVGVVAGTEAYSKRVLDALPELKVVSRCGTGTDAIDRAAAEARGLIVRNTPDGPVAAVAELTVGLILALLRQIPRHDRDMRAGIWKKRMGNLLLGKRVGVVGFGRIGRAVAERLAPFGVEIAYCDPFVEDGSYPKLPLDPLLDWADVVTLHCSKTENDGPLLDLGRLSLMRPGSFVVNAARGSLVDETALYGLLTAGHLGGAAIDVHSKEPYDGPLKDMPNVILTPHIGSYAREARVGMETAAVENLLDALRNGN